MPSKKKIMTPQQLWEGVSSRFVHFVEDLFFILGVKVGRHPVKTIMLSWLFVILSCIGLMKFHIEKNPMKLWIPPDSDFYKDTYWYVDKFGTAFRLQRLLVEAEDVLQPEMLMTVYNITKQVNSLEVHYNNSVYNLKDLCFKVPAITNLFGSELKTKSEEQVSGNSSLFTSTSDSQYSDPTLWVDEEFYCSFIENFELLCLQYNIVDLFKNDLDLIKNATKHDIVTKVNNAKRNPITGHGYNYTQLLGGISRDESGDIVAAKSLLLTWYTSVNMSAVDLDEVGNLVGTEDWVSPALALWEQHYLELMQSMPDNYKNVTFYYEAGRSFGDTSGNAIFDELDKLFLSITLMFFYIQFGLSRWNWLEIRLTLGGVGLLCVGMAYITAVSWCSVIGVPFGPVHASLPFLLMGLGVDDMFVMKACWENLSEADSRKSLPYKVGLMLKHAGFSIEAILRLEQRFDPKWFIPEHSSYKQYINAHEYYYPNEGHTGMIFLGEMDYQQELTNLHDLTRRLEKEWYIDDVETWIDAFHGYVKSNFGHNVYNTTAVSNDKFQTLLSRFLFSPIGGKYQMNFKFSQPFTCGHPAANITASHLAFKFAKLTGPEEHIPAMNHLKSLVRNVTISSGDGYRSVWSKAFANWVTDEVIALEVERNVELTLLCVMVCTMVLITNLQMCFWIFMCVLLTLVNVLGFMQRWGMTVDIVCCIGLELAIGLCVDYAAHVGHTFLTITDGSRQDRALKTITSIGGAVLLGGGATLLSLSLLSMSQAYTFQTFAKIFLLVIIFGLFNGLVFLPVVLSLIGPAGHKKREDDIVPEEVEMNGKHLMLEK
ncbi:hypothetical protein MSG28_002754 [Choristoneura fumiferana]|uniref:Uncharacterized protein n=1 Tax=Choristoneura fumiferana TaxID=7141 RepID=A0ACC0JJ92_CHOFU|nr:hypothetical protein MSG28_002754 [Choristoneura fumiferana]